MKPRVARSLSVLLTGALVAVGLTIMPNAATAATDDIVTTSEVAAAINHIDSGSSDALVAEPVTSTTDANSAAVTVQGTTTIDVAKQPEDGVSFLTEGAAKVSVTIPNTETAGDGQRTPDGSVIYSGTEGTASAVIPTEAGVQMLTTIAKPDAPSLYTYEVTVPDGGNITLVDAAAEVRDANGITVLSVPTPWARDAAGNSVPTHFSTDGKSLTQVVEHTVASYEYPIVADPVWIVGAFVVAFTFVWQHAVRGCGLGGLVSAAYQALVYGWVWRDIVRAGRDGCVTGLLGGYRGFVRRW